MQSALYAKLPTATETLQPSQAPKRLERRAVPSEMIICGYKNGDPAAMTTAESGSYKYTYVTCGAVAATDTYCISSKSPGIDKSRFTKYIDNTTSSGSATEATAEVSDDNRSESRRDSGAIVGGAIVGLIVVCETAVAMLYLLRNSCAQKPKTTPETGQGMTEAPGQTETDNGPKELVGSKPSGVPANRQTAELQGTLVPCRPGPVELPYDGVTRECPKVSDRKR
ncbi:hypothetical protein FMUND_7821 [Fusarium mundagurra]|uniref:Uncharacterized protein n=1 Tax=Fusarium mundagurra TaxID=1567541 RepID=A0A8H5YL84_9HYPO|nr:hypothetical protein FMUND_7821 [Fusarium mundagurra]